MKSAFPALVFLTAAVFSTHGLIPPPDSMIVTTRDLSSGSRLHFQRDENSAVTAIVMASRGGRGAVPPDRDGLAHLVSRLVVDFPDEAKVRDMMSRAATLSVNVIEDASFIRIECLSEYLDPVLKTAASIIQNPLLTPLRIERIKGQMTPMSERQEDHSRILAHRTVFSAFFEGRGYGGWVYGKDDTLKSLDRKAIQEFYLSRFASENVYFTAVSDLSEQTVSELLEKHFDRLPRREAEPPEVPDPPLKPESGELRVLRDTRQTYVGYAYPVLGMSRRHYVLALLCETVLGKGPGSRLWPLRVRDKLAYSVDAVFTPTRGGGILIAFIETQNASSGDAASRLHETLGRLKNEGLSAEEFEAARTTAGAFFLRRNETKEARATTLAVFEALGLGAGFFREFTEELAAVSLEDANGFLRDLLDPEWELRIIIGPGTD